MGRLRPWAALMLLYLAACGISVPPSGGPEDKTAPEVGELTPARDSAGVSPDAELMITFSENMTRMRLEGLVSMSPEVEFEKPRWKGRTLILKPTEPLHEDTTYVVTIKPGFKDNHGVTNHEGFSFAFATSAHIDSGTIAGQVFFRREASNAAVVRCFALPVDTGFVPGAARPDREAAGDETGFYEIQYLPTDGARFLLWAFHDKNGNKAFERDSEAGMMYPDTLELRSNLTSLPGRDIYIIDPTEPATLSGRVINLTGVDTMLVSVGLYVESDTIPPVYYTVCDSLGDFTFERVTGGAYLLKAFLDFRGDSLCGDYPCPADTTTMCVEPCVTLPDSVRLAPGEEITLEALEL